MLRDRLDWFRADHLGVLRHRNPHILQEHEPAHFHAEHAGQRAKCDFSSKVIAGEIRSRKARERISQWAQLLRSELDANWDKMKGGRPLETIEPSREGKR